MGNSWDVVWTVTELVSAFIVPKLTAILGRLKYKAFKTSLSWALKHCRWSFLANPNSNIFPKLVSASTSEDGRRKKTYSNSPGREIVLLHLHLPSNTKVKHFQDQAFITLISFVFHNTTAYNTFQRGVCLGIFQFLGRENTKWSWKNIRTPTWNRVKRILRARTYCTTFNILSFIKTHQDYNPSKLPLSIRRIL